jgi:hypothetical protein
MDRRGFLQRLASAAAAMVAATQSGEIAASLVAAPKVMDGPAPRRLCEAQQAVLDVLKECRIISCSVEQIRGVAGYSGYSQYRVTYRRDKGHGLTGYVETLADIGIPKAMTMSCVQSVDVFDASHLGALALARFTPTYEIEVVWLVP